MKNQRPVNLDLSKFSFPVPAIVSILHRVSGVFIFVGVAVLLWLLDASLASEESFSAVKETLSQPLWRLVLWLTLSALAYHTVAGVRHLLMDMAIGETLRGGQVGAYITLIVSLILIVLAGVWVW